jgi:hypothetical protein
MAVERRRSHPLLPIRLRQYPIPPRHCLTHLPEASIVINAIAYKTRMNSMKHLSPRKHSRNAEHVASCRNAQMISPPRKPGKRPTKQKPLLSICILGKKFKSYSKQSIPSDDPRLIVERYPRRNFTSLISITIFPQTYLKKSQNWWQSSSWIVSPSRRNTSSHTTANTS